MAGPCQNKGWGGEKWSEKKAEGAGMGNGRRWDERKGRDGPKWPAPARIRGEERKNGAKRGQRRT